MNSAIVQNELSLFFVLAEIILFVAGIPLTYRKKSAEMAVHTETGNKGEKLALQYLQKMGYTILDTNWHTRHYEIDIIARDGNELVIVEVKTRTGDHYGHPSEAVNNKKIRRLINAAERYIHLHNMNLDTRFDVISIIFLDRKFHLEHIKDAFYPTAR